MRLRWLVLVAVMEEFLELPALLGKQEISEKPLVFAGEDDGEEGRQYAREPQAGAEPLHLIG